MHSIKFTQNYFQIKMCHLCFPYTPLNSQSLLSPFSLCCKSRSKRIKLFLGLADYVTKLTINLHTDAAVTNYFFICRKTDWKRHMPQMNWDVVGWEWYHPSDNAYFLCSAKKIDNPWQCGKTYQVSDLVVNENIPWRPNTATDEDMSMQVLTTMTRSPTEETRCLSEKMEIVHNSTQRRN